ncbi:MAG: poly-gamma-glutamate synthase PgsB, partial [Candidatus Methylomirabilis sp.]|nr:poly-gamma-glutamate synthase PgsB [Deltaproteobacteria bacterium]
MFLPIALLSLIALLAVLGIAEYAVHKRRLGSIPIRVHVNGTRGKSSVTRLVAAALREHGVRTFAKTTGTLPRMIMADGHEYPVYRISRANIVEQLRIVGIAAREGAEALVIECMGLQPQLQSLSERKMIRATHGVITNARADHLDVMGPSERDVALALLGTTPVGAKLFTAERDYPAEFAAACADRGSELHALTEEDVAAVTDEDLAGFGYVEHRENVALALKVALSLGITRETAMRGMWKTPSDPGAMRDYHLEFFGREVVFINGFAANDPESSERIWNMALDRYPNVQRRFMILNCREDRTDRSQQLGAAEDIGARPDQVVAVGGPGSPPPASRPW